MQLFSRRFTVFAALTAVGGGVVLQSALSSAPSGGSAAASATATVQDDGTVAVTGLSLPSQSVELSAECTDLSDPTVRVVCAAEAFLASLSDEERTQVVLDAAQANATVWSNLPTSLVQRNGVALESLTAEQQGLALAVVKAATGTSGNNGYSEVTQLLMADDVLNASGGAQLGGAPASGGTPPNGIPGGGADGMSDGGPPGGFSGGGPGMSGGAGGFPGGGSLEYASGLYYLAFLGEPSATGTWTLQFGGHHLAINTTYRAGEVASATPEFVGVEPLVWTTENATYAPLEDEQAGMVAMLGGLTGEQRAAAKLSETYSDVLVGPGEDGNFPETKAGLAVSELSAEQQALVLAAMRPWVRDADDATAAELLAIYEDELDETYIAFSGDPSLTNNADYVRIDGPSVWIELVCQGGIVYSEQIHYHTVWRDHERDYGAEYNF